MNLARMDFDELFEDLEARFGAMIAAAENERQAQALELRLVGGLPHELVAAGGRILLLSPQIGADYVAGLEATNGNWYAIRIELIRELRRVARPNLAGEQLAGLTETENTLAEMMNEWLTPLRLKVLLAGDRQFAEMRLSTISVRAIGVAQLEGLVEIPIANIRVIRANFTELA